MRTRLLVVVSVLVVAVVLGLGIPLAMSAAAGSTAEMFTDRLGDTTRFAALAQRAITDSDTAALGAELARYDQLYDAPAAVLDRQGDVLVASRPDVLVTDDPDDGARVALALAGRRSPTAQTIWPWDTRPMLLAEPVLVGGEVRGAAVTVSPTGALRGGVLIVWGGLAAAGLVALAVAALAALPLVRWILAPIEELDAGTARVAAAVRAGRPAEPVGAERGPPELRRLTRDFDAMAATVSATLEAQRSFVADAGHQLRNPLTALRLRLATHAEDLVDAPVAPEVRDGPGAALEEVDRLTAVLDALLALARTEGRVAPPVEVALDRVLDERVGTWAVLAEYEGLDLHRAGARGLVVPSDPVTVATVLDAVLDNAVKYAPPGSAVELTTARVEGAVEVAVRDHGPGLAPDELDRATERFWRKSWEDGGSGLGLAIAARGAERAGAALALELPDDGGLRVVLRWPPTRA
ncbi:sensor histidine kinase [Actinomycetospora termitidis]|uniref:histidine kinase n=1 Tax=Actinomycetospora termitidis TaxID=3053470 RepID=A0ABT7M6U3_9PSEU|nr:HAMP domain-containing sensor histidine kinase [Actinomycetospora sp. Odt1-22]MDL5156390.1 HAMP domain-containing sensor histidine kinase [Actinomycetospora sp. Odt1-22]